MTNKKILENYIKNASDVRLFELGDCNYDEFNNLFMEEKHKQSIESIRNYCRNSKSCINTLYGRREIYKQAIYTYIGNGFYMDLGLILDPPK